MKLKKLKNVGLGCLVFVVVGLALALYLVNKEIEYFGEHPNTSGKTVSIILIDGLSQDVFKHALSKKELPNLEFLTNNGIYIENGIGSFPSMTGYAFYPFITGRDAAESGILGLRWFDRARNVGNLRNYVGRTNVHMNQDLSDSIKTIFELSGDAYTASINSYMNKGVDDGRITGWTHTTAKYEGKSVFGAIRSIPAVGKELAKDHFQHENEVMRMAKKQLQDNPKVQWITLPSPDASHHVFGMTNAYPNLLKYIDFLIGDFMRTIDSLGQGDSRMIAVLTDHGVSDVHQNLDIIPLAQQKLGIDLVRGNSVNYRSMLLDTPIEDFIHKDGYWVINGNLSAYLYLRDPNKEGVQSWRNNLSYEDLLNYRKNDNTVNIPRSFAQLEGIQLVICKKDSASIIVHSKNGFATITRKNELYQYHTDSADPLEYSSLNLLDTFLTKDAWLAETVDSKYPDAVYRLFTLMQSPKIGDLVITSEEGYDLAKDYEVIVGNYKGGHGGLRSDQLRVPYFLYNKNLTKNTINHMRAEKIGQIIIDWLEFDNN